MVDGKQNTTNAVQILHTETRVTMHPVYVCQTSVGNQLPEEQEATMAMDGESREIGAGMLQHREL
jgi:hypothetical protein